jgi:hypothetical protein
MGRLPSAEDATDGKAAPQIRIRVSFSIRGSQSCFLSSHVGWTGKEKKAELTGKDRLNAIELNVFVPYRLAKGDSTVLENLPVEPMNSGIRETACTLFGP